MVQKNLGEEKILSKKSKRLSFSLKQSLACCQAQFQLAIQASAELRLAILSLSTPPTQSFWGSKFLRGKFFGGYNFFGSKIFWAKKIELNHFYTTQEAETLYVCLI